MSLVNDMLRDLNKRTPVSNQAARVHGAIQSSIENKRPKAKLGLILAGGLLLGLGAGYFYFESMGVQLVPVPLAVSPGQPASQQTVLPAATTPAAQPASETPGDASTNNVPAAGALLAVENVAEIRELASQPNGFTLLIETSELTTFDTRDRSPYGLTLHVDGVDKYDRTGTAIPGMSLLLVSDGLDIGIELTEAADFLVREDTETPGFDILLSATYRGNDVTTAEVLPQQENDAVAQATPNSPAAQSGLASLSSERSTPARVNRELSFEDQDRTNSQTALVLVQGGRMVEAYQRLLVFLEENPEAHQSRETLAKLLLAQKEYVQAGVIIDQGLAQVPNYASFKKIKARLLMQANDPAQALALLRNVPPSVAADTEYHELLASLYQKGNYQEQAVTTYQELLRIDRQQGNWWAGLAISLEAQDMDADALASYQAALQTPNLDASVRQFVQNRISILGSPQ